MDKDEHRNKENLTNERTPAHNSTYKKLAVQRFNQALCFVSISVLADIFVLRNRQLLVATKRYRQPLGDSATFKHFA